MKLAVLKKRAGRSWVNLKEVFLPLSEVNFFFFFLQESSLWMRSRNTLNEDVSISGGTRETMEAAYMTKHLFMELGRRIPYYHCERCN